MAFGSSSTTYPFLIAALIIGILGIAVQNAPGDDPIEWSQHHHQNQPTGLPLPDNVNETNITITATSATSFSIQFPSGSETLTGHLYLPKESSSTTTTTTSPPPPVVIMAQGLGLTQDCRVEKYIQAFQMSNFAVFTFDYATFGESTGVPRHQIDPMQQNNDLQTAIRMIQQHHVQWDIDGNRMALWGTSFGGGHVLYTAGTTATTMTNKDNPIRAVIAQVPALASATEVVIGGSLLDRPMPTIWSLLQIATAGLKWIQRYIIGYGKLSWYVPLTGLPGSSGLMQNYGDYMGYMSLIPTTKDAMERNQWRNLVTFPSVLRILLYRPINRAIHVAVPVLLIAAEKDTLCPVHYAKQMAQKLDNVQLMIIPQKNHFDVYSGQALEGILSASVQFLQQNFA